MAEDDDDVDNDHISLLQDFFLWIYFNRSENLEIKLMKITW